MKKIFQHLTNQQLINKANAAPDFGWDDEGQELARRKKEEGLMYKMVGNTLKLIN